MYFLLELAANSPNSMIVVLNYWYLKASALARKGACLLHGFGEIGYASFKFLEILDVMV